MTSTSLMVTGRALDEAVGLSRDHPELAIGLHWDVWGEDERENDLGDRRAVVDEFHRQIDEFFRVMGRLPTPIDSDRHAHRQPSVEPLVRELVGAMGLPLRGDGRVNFIGGFYAQWEDGVTELEDVSVPALMNILKHELAPSWNEVSCHAGDRSPDFRSISLVEREEEVRTITDPRNPQTIHDLGLGLASYAEFFESPKNPGSISVNGFGSIPNEKIG